MTTSHRFRAAVAASVTIVVATVAPASNGTVAGLDPAFGPSDDIWIERNLLRALPTFGAAWENLAETATAPWGTPNLSDQTSDHDIHTLAGALYAVRMNDLTMRSRVVASIEGVIGTEDGSIDSLGVSRNLTGYVLAADIVGHRSSGFVAWLTAVRNVDLDGRSVISTHADRPNNWGTHAGAARIAAARYLGDDADLAAAIDVLRGFLGDRSAHAEFTFGDSSWQANPAAPVPVNPAGSTRNGHVVDGALVDDIRRCGCAASTPPPKENYQWEAMQGLLTQAVLAERAGHPDVWNWSDRAIERAARFLYERAQYPAEGDDTFVVYLLDHGLGTNYSAGVAARTGKAMGFTDWTHSGLVRHARTAAIADATAVRVQPPRS